MLISVGQLARCLSESGVQVFDCRFSLADTEAGYREYQKGHLPDAIHADLNRHLSAGYIRGVTGRHPLPEKADWIRQVLAWGIMPSSQVILYDDAGGAIAARMWWMLRWIGHKKVAVLNGGWQAWNKAGFPVTDEIPQPEAAVFDYGKLPSLTRQVEVDELDCARHFLIDARELARFRGDVETIDPVAGHIPGAICSPFSENLDSEGCFRSKQELAEKFATVMTRSESQDIVCYCGSGVTAAHNILALKLAGFDEPALYAGSWSEWITRLDREIARGD